MERILSESPELTSTNVTNLYFTHYSCRNVLTYQHKLLKRSIILERAKIEVDKVV